MTSEAVYPVDLSGELTEPLSRWLWLVKWLLAIPHYIILAFLGITFVILTLVAFFNILFTGRYPRSIFDFNVGVLRWGWRVGFYTYSALGTDKYPPFSLSSDDTYPADITVEYPSELSRGLIFIKWLLAIPHFIVVGFFQGGMGFPKYGGLISIFSLFAGVALLVTGRYPKSIFSLILGMNRWALRVTAYAGLMCDEYPPFRLEP